LVEAGEAMDQLTKELRERNAQLAAYTNKEVAEMSTNTDVDEEKLELRKETKQAVQEKQEMKGWFRATSPEVGKMKGLPHPGTLADAVRLNENERTGMLKLHQVIVKAYRSIKNNADADHNQRSMSPTGSPYSPPSSGYKAAVHTDAMKSLAMSDSASLMKWDAEMLDVVYRWILTNVDAYDNLMNPTKPGLAIGGEDLLQVDRVATPPRSKTRLGGAPSSRLTTPMIDVKRSSTSHRNRAQNMFGANTGLRHHQLRDRLSRDRPPTSNQKYPFRAVDSDFGLNTASGREMLKTPNYFDKRSGARGGNTVPIPPPAPMVGLTNLFHK